MSDHYLLMSLIWGCDEVEDEVYVLKTTNGNPSASR